MHRFAHAAALVAVATLPACAPAANERTSPYAGTLVTQVTYLHTATAAGPFLVTGADGAVVEERRFEPFGAPLGGVDYDGEPLGAQGRLVDPGTGLADHGVRWSSADSARWLSVDPIVRQPDVRFARSPWQLHPYQYAGSAPTLYWDPDGRDLRIMGARAGDLVGRLEAATGLDLVRDARGTVTVVGVNGGGSLTAAATLFWITADDRQHVYVEAMRGDDVMLVGRPHERATRTGQYQVDMGDLDQLDQVIDPRLAASAAMHEVFEAYLESFDADGSKYFDNHARAKDFENGVLDELGAGFQRTGERNVIHGDGSGVYHAEFGRFDLEVPYEADGRHGQFRRVDKP